MDADRILTGYLGATPSDEETARRTVEPYRDLDPGARLEALATLLRGMDTLLGGRTPFRAPDDVAFWRHWKDPFHGGPG